MIRTLGLILPALIPSWNFFDIIAPSPRIEFRHLTQEATATEWQAFRPRPRQLGPATMLRRMLWNPQWNETLYTMSLSERLIANPTDHSETEILNRIRHDLLTTNEDLTGHIQFRLVFIYRESDRLEQEELFVSRQAPLGQADT